MKGSDKFGRWETVKGAEIKTDVGATLTVKEMQEVCEALNGCDEFLDNYSDVIDGPDGQQRPNRAMQLRELILEGMTAMDAAMNRVEP